MSDITITLTEDQAYRVIADVRCNFIELWDEDDPVKKEADKVAAKSNEFGQSIIGIINTELNK